jgi:tetratricopeptide (TPR) repeat protein
VVYLNDYLQARASLEEGLAISREIQYPSAMTEILRYLGWHALRQQDYRAARPWLEESLKLHRRLGKADTTRVLDSLGELHFYEGDYAQARAYFEEGVLLARESDRMIVSYWLLARLGYVALRQGDHALARSVLIEAQRNFKDGGVTIGVIYTLEALASLSVINGQPEAAARLLAWADAAREEIDDTRPPVEQVAVDRDLATIRVQLGDEAFTAAQAEGRAMSMDEAIACALREDH